VEHRSKDKPMQKRYQERRMSKLRLLPGYLLLALALTILLPQMLAVTISAAGRAITSIPNWLSNLSIGVQSSGLAPMFTSQVDYWSTDIQRWARQYDLDPNLLATVMQIESCGHDAVASHAGAQGLFQVMPFHFSAGEDMLDPDTNAMRGASFLNECLGYANGDPGLAMACYNGGPSVLRRDYSTWPEETQRYFTWGRTIYLEAQQNKSASIALQNWLDAGGSNLCSRAANRLGL
jgi:soluble lytic murein transglycosylase-like protein